MTEIERDRPSARIRIRTVMALVACAAVACWLGFYQWPVISQWWVNRHIQAALDADVPVNIPAGTPLDGVIKLIRTANVSPALPSGAPVYIDPAGLTRAGATMNSTIAASSGTMPLKTALSAALNPLGLEYQTKDGMIRITAKGAK